MTKHIALTPNWSPFFFSAVGVTAAVQPSAETSPFVLKYKPSISSPLKRSRAEFEYFNEERYEPGPQAKKQHQLEEAEGRVDWLGLPEELGKVICSFLPLPDVARASQVCWKWVRWTMSDDEWVQRYTLRWGFRPDADPCFVSLEQPWARFFSHRYLAERENLFDPVTEHDPNTFRQWGEALFNQGAALRAWSAERAFALLNVALQEYHSAVTLDPCNAQGWILYGDVISDFASMLPQGTHRRLILQQTAASRYARAKTLLEEQEETRRQRRAAAEQLEQQQVQQFEPLSLMHLPALDLTAPQVVACIGVFGGVEFTTIPPTSPLPSPPPLSPFAFLPSGLPSGSW